jgi:hypothetical protein
MKRKTRQYSHIHKLYSKYLDHMHLPGHEVAIRQDNYGLFFCFFSRISHLEQQSGLEKLQRRNIELRHLRAYVASNYKCTWCIYEN